jgi:hypothetical protein
VKHRDDVFLVTLAPFALLALTCIQLLALVPATELRALEFSFGVATVWVIGFARNVCLNRVPFGAGILWNAMP